MKCPKCGTENAASRVLCVRCGTRLRATVGAPPGAPAGPEAAATVMAHLGGDLRRLVVVVAAVVATMIALGMLLH
ncbi:MAG: zinc-ribbon domain-containing protein [Armatimonadota bacterium]|nr:zinc-ribbon domain-containing protein [Armatimonadota bacterium]